MIESAVAGLVWGGAYAILGIMVVFMFRMVRVVNFSQAAIGAFGVFVMVEFHESGWAYIPSVLAGVAAGTAIAALLGLIMAYWFADATLETRSTVAIAMLLAMLATGFRVFEDKPRSVPEPISGGVDVFGVTVTNTAITVLILTALLAVGLRYFLMRTRTGLQLRALSERAQTAELLGVPALRLSIAVWAVGGLFATVALLMLAPSRFNAFGSLSLLIIPALAAAAFGLFRSFPAAALGGLFIGLLEGLANYSGALRPYQAAVPLVVLVLILVWSQRREVWDVAR